VTTTILHGGEHDDRLSGAGRLRQS
jgi:hypothetical protein